jgi:hypothetical protein
MRTRSSFERTVFFLVGCLLASGCAHGPQSAEQVLEAMRPKAEGLKPVKLEEPVTLRLKAEMGRTEKVSYTHRAVSNSYEDNQLRHKKEDALDFTSQAETLKVEPADSNGVSKFTQVLTILKKDGSADLHDFAMPDLGERLEVTADSLGHIFKSGDYPPNSIFYVSPMSLPEKPVSIGDTWTMQASWLSLEDMVPYQLDMVSILKGFLACGSDTCADIEISGQVTFQGPLLQSSLQFKSQWQGRTYFAMNAGTVIWSRVDSDERLISEKVRRDVSSCLEAVLVEPQSEALQGLKGSRCEPIQKTDTVVAP